MRDRGHRSQWHARRRLSQRTQYGERSRRSGEVDLGSRCKASIKDNVYIIEYGIISVQLLCCHHPGLAAS
jgi:hypothetical protein